MKVQYKEYKVLDKDIGELIMLRIAEEDIFTMSTIEDIEEMKIKGIICELEEILKSGKIIDFLNTLSRNKLKSIIRKLVLNREELQIYELHYKKGYTQADIRKMLGITRQSVNKKVKKMNEKMEEISGLFENKQI